MSDVGARTNDDDARDRSDAESCRIVELPGRGGRPQRRYGGVLLGGG
ncbi:hemolysin D, partial [Bradyrhizobium sp. CCBAU 21359]|nr:hemolysin D [Bradyrhizobium sp. CCBAU 21359]